MTAHTSGGTWYTWVTGDSTTASTDINNATWDTWVASSATTSATIWYAWNEGTTSVSARKVYQYKPAPETEAQKQARLAREAEAARQAEERRKKEAEALQRAEDLLMLQLNAKQQQDWRTQKAFEVLSQSGKRFRIRNAPSMNVDELDQQGKIVSKHCIVSRERVPLPDQLVMQKLMLEHHEADFMQIANHRVN